MTWPVSPASAVWRFSRITGTNWDAENDIFLKPLNDLSLDAWFKTLQRNHIPFDFVDFRPESTMENLAPYDLLIAPHDAVLTEKQAALLEQTVFRRKNADPRRQNRLQG